MSTTKFIIKEIKNNDKFINIKTEDNKDLGVNMSFADNKEFVELLLKASVGDTIEGIVKEYGGKLYLNPAPKAGAGNGKSFGPRVITDVEVAMNAAASAAQVLGLTKDVPKEKITEYAEHLYLWIKSKKTA